MACASKTRRNESRVRTLRPVPRSWPTWKHCLRACAAAPTGPATEASAQVDAQLGDAQEIDVEVPRVHEDADRVHEGAHVGED